MLFNFLKKNPPKKDIDNTIAEIKFTLDENFNVNFKCVWQNQTIETCGKFSQLLYDINSGVYSDEIIKQLTEKAIKSPESRNFIASVILQLNLLTSSTQTKSQPLVQPLGAFFKNVKNKT